MAEEEANAEEKAKEVEASELESQEEEHVREPESQEEERVPIAAPVACQPSRKHKGVPSVAPPVIICEIVLAPSSFVAGRKELVQKAHKQKEALMWFKLLVKRKLGSKLRVLPNMLKRLLP